MQEYKAASTGAARSGLRTAAAQRGFQRSSWKSASDAHLKGSGVGRAGFSMGSELQVENAHYMPDLEGSCRPQLPYWKEHIGALPHTRLISPELPSCFPPRALKGVINQRKGPSHAKGGRPASGPASRLASHRERHNAIDARHERGENA